MVGLLKTLQRIPQFLRSGPQTVGAGYGRVLAPGSWTGDISKCEDFRCHCSLPHLLLSGCLPDAEIMLFLPIQKRGWGRIELAPRPSGGRLKKGCHSECAGLDFAARKRPTWTRFEFFEQRFQPCDLLCAFFELRSMCCLHSWGRGRGGASSTPTGEEGGRLGVPAGWAPPKLDIELQLLCEEDIVDSFMFAAPFSGIFRKWSCDYRNEDAIFGGTRQSPFCSL